MKLNIQGSLLCQVRPHYVSRLAALDTGERDRALQELEVVGWPGLGQL